MHEHRLLAYLVALALWQIPTVQLAASPSELSRLWAEVQEAVLPAERDPGALMHALLR